MSSKMDTSRTIEIPFSRRKVLMLTLGCLAFTFAGVAITIDASYGLTVDRAAQFAGTMSAIFFGFGTLSIPWNMFKTRGPVLTISPAGFRDCRISADPIGWHVIKSISTSHVASEEFMVVTVDAETERQLFRTPVTRTLVGVNRRLGINGIGITARGLATDSAKLLAMTTAYHATWGNISGNRVNPNPSSRRIAQGYALARPNET